MANNLAKGGIAEQRSLDELWSELYCSTIRVEKILDDARFAETVRAAKK
jgi:hypothetical protein